MIEPIENVLEVTTIRSSNASLEEVPQIKEVSDKKPEIAVVTTLKEEPVDFKSAVKTTLERPRKKSKSTKKRKRCPKGKRRNKGTHRCRKKLSV